MHQVQPQPAADYGDLLIDCFYRSIHSGERLDIPSSIRDSVPLIPEVLSFHTSIAWILPR